ncbi:MAG: hypothetical protein H7263_09420, partial [Candidatus Sericytochromatia bacterium]|nr:hypothetical protein [Candidatus Sericytochromatia bacterium]
MEHLQTNGFPHTWDYAKPDNIIINHNQGHIKDIRSIDLQGSKREHSAIEDYGSRIENPYAQFQSRKGQEIRTPATREERKKGAARMIEEAKN